MSTSETSSPESSSSDGDEQDYYNYIAGGYNQLHLEEQRRKLGKVYVLYLGLSPHVAVIESAGNSRY